VKLADPVRRLAGTIRVQVTPCGHRKRRPAVLLRKWVTRISL
jgi:hypothetical protein